MAVLFVGYDSSMRQQATKFKVSRGDIFQPPQEQ